MGLPSAKKGLGSCLAKKFFPAVCVAFTFSPLADLVPVWLRRVSSIPGVYPRRDALLLAEFHFLLPLSLSSCYRWI